MKLTQIVKNVGRKALIVGGLTLASFFISPTITQADKFADDDFTTSELNTLINSASAGETVFLDCTTDGIYQTDPSALSFFRLKENVNLSKNPSCLGEVVLQGNPQVNNPLILLIDSCGITVSGITLRGTNRNGIGFVADCNDPTNPIVITGNNLEDLSKIGQWNNRIVVGDNSSSTIKFIGNNLINYDIGPSFAANSGDLVAVNAQTAYLEYAGNTSEGLGLLGLQFPLYPIGNTNPITFVAPGINLFDNNIFINSDGVILTQDAMSATGIPATVAGVTGIPDANGEYQIALNPDPSFPYVSTLKDAFGGDNFVGDPLFTIYRRPLPGSPAIIHSPEGVIVSGAFPRAGDINRDGILDDVDRETILEAIAMNNVGLTTEEIETFDMDSNGQVTHEDYKILMQDYQGTAVPAASTWTLIILGLSLTIAGTLISNRSRFSQVLLN